MLRIKNLTNSPYPIMMADGSKEILPARGEIDADIHPQHLSLYRSLGYFVISNVSEGGGQVEVAREEDAGSDIGGGVSTGTPKTVPAKRGRPRKEK